MKLILSFLARNWGNVASVIGLVFSILAFIFSKKATEAVREARAAILRRNFGDDMNMASRAAADIVAHVRGGHGEIALLRISDLMSQASYMVRRWDSSIPEDSRNNLLEARAQLGVVHEILSKATVAELDPRKRAKVIGACQRVCIAFNEEHGAAIKRVDA